MEDAAPSLQAALARLVRPRSVAIVGASPEPGTFSNNVLANLERCYEGAIHLVSRSIKEINGRRCVPTIDDLPEGIDAIVLNVPERAVLDAVAASIRRGIGGAVIFAAGFAETGADGRANQARLAALARAGGLALNGPNCAGLVNFIDGVPLTFEPGITRADRASAGVGVLAQSGGMMGNVRVALGLKGVRTSYSVSTGNEAVLGVEDFFEFLLAGEESRVIALFIEEVRRPRRFLELARRARAQKRPVVMMHPGRTQRARAAAQTHTGAMAGDHALMATVLRREGVLLVDTLDAFFDVLLLLMRWPAPPPEGAAVMTNSGAFRSIALDFAAEAGLGLPPLAQATRARLKAVLPPYATVDNPLDMTVIGTGSPAVYGDTTAALLDDPAIGGLITAFMPGAPQLQALRAETMLPAIERAGKPVAFAHFCDGAPLTPEFVAAARGAGIPLFASPDRAMRAMALLAEYGRMLRQSPPAAAGDAPPLPGSGTIPEYRAKAFLAAAGICVPAGLLARDPAEAAAAASRVGYPVALKAQAAALTHKSDAGGVILAVADAAALRAAWERLHANLARAGAPALEGVLVEAMAAPGIEMIIGARRDPKWGPVLMVGLGGIWTEALGDVRLMPADLDAAEILAQFGTLKGADLLAGRRGRAPLDAAAVAAAAAILGRLVRAAPEIVEIEINPLVVHQAGAIALDALMRVAEA
jgi:acetate---CoA ligase (ADP-forming)